MPYYPPASGGGGTSDHAALTHLDKASSGHTGFEDAGAAASAVSTHAALTATHGATGAVVGETNTQTLANKTLTTPTIASFANATHTHEDAAGGGELDHAALTNLAYADAAHTGFAGTGVVNTFGRQQTIQTSLLDTTLGSDLFVNGAFGTDPFAGDWAHDVAGWAWDTGAVVHTPGSGGEISQAFSCTPNNLFVFEVSITALTAGSLDVYDDTQQYAHVTANGVHAATGYIPNGHASNSIYIDVDEFFDGRIEYVSIKQITAGGASVIVKDANGNTSVEISPFASGVVITSPGYIVFRGTEFLIPSMPSSPSGRPQGALYKDGTVVNVA